MKLRPTMTRRWVDAQSKHWEHSPGVLGTEGTTVQCPGHMEPMDPQNPEELP